MKGPTHFGSWLRRAIEDTGLSVVAFCDRTIIARGTMQKWLARPCPPIRGHNIVRLARGLGISREAIEEKLNEARMGTVENAAA